MSAWNVKRWLIVLGVTAVTGMLIAIPTGIIRTPFYTRMTPVLWWNYPIWAISSVLAGLLAFLGVQLALLGPSGSINIPFTDPLVQFANTWFLPPWAA